MGAGQQRAAPYWGQDSNERPRAPAPFDDGKGEKEEEEDDKADLTRSSKGQAVDDARARVCEGENDGAAGMMEDNVDDALTPPKEVRDAARLWMMRVRLQTKPDTERQGAWLAKSFASPCALAALQSKPATEEP